MERGIECAREIECAVLGNDDPVASVAGEIVPEATSSTTTRAKYLDDDGAQLVIPADLPPSTLDGVQRLAVAAFRAIECCGHGAGRLLPVRDDEVWINEINTIPGFTSISMYPKLWEASGLAYDDLVERLIDLAIERHAVERAKGTIARELEP